MHREQWRPEAGEGRRERIRNNRTFNLQNQQLSRLRNVERERGSYGSGLQTHSSPVSRREKTGDRISQSGARCAGAGAGGGGPRPGVCVFVCGSCLAAPLLFVVCSRAAVSFWRRRIPPFLPAAAAPAAAAWRVRSGRQDSTIHMPQRVTLSLLSKRLPYNAAFWGGVLLVSTSEFAESVLRLGLATAERSTWAALLATLFNLPSPASAFTEPPSFQRRTIRCLAHTLPPML